MSPLSNVCHILYLTDLSAAGSPAWQHALMLAQLLHAQVHIVYWADHLGYTWTAPQAESGPDADLFAKSATAISSGTALRPDLKQVTAEDAAAVATGGGGIDLVVLGLAVKQTIQADTLPEVLLRNLACPLWVVGPECQAAERPTRTISLPGASHVAPPRRILYASPLRHDGIAPRLASYFAGIDQGALTMIHVLPYSAADEADEVVRKDGVFERTGKALAALIEGDSPSPLRVTVRSAVSRAEVILEEASSSDLIVLPVHAISAWTLVGDGTVARIIERVRCSVLLVPENWGVKPEEALGS